MREIVINKAFLELPEKKQQTILNAAFAEFGVQGYERASTNTIVKKAGISKGTLFYYFNSKQELFNDLALTAIDHALKRYEPYLNSDTPDYLDWMYATAREKIKAQHEQPEEFRFLGQLYLSEDKHYLQEQALNQFDLLVQASLEALSKPFDMSAFREDIPQDIMQKIVNWTTDGYQKEITARMQADESLWDGDGINALWDEFYEYLEVLKRLFYKERN